MILREKWLSLCEKVGLEGSGQWQRIQFAYTESHRTYHTLTHIEECLDRLEENRDLVTDPTQLKFAIWFHDLIYNTRAFDNEERSAEAAFQFLKGTSIAESVTELIKATKHGKKPTSLEAQLLCDIDLSVLGGDSRQYRQYAEAIRQEYHWVPAQDYILGRIRILRMFLNRDSIYCLPGFHEQYEEQARTNLESEIKHLNQSSESSRGSIEE